MLFSGDGEGNGDELIVFVTTTLLGDAQWWPTRRFCKAVVKRFFLIQKRFDCLSKFQKKNIELKTK